MYTEESSSPIGRESAGQASGPPRQDWRVLIDNPRVLVAILFLVTAALGLPFLWMSRAFSFWWKVFLSVAVIAWTVFILWIFWLIMLWCWGRLEPVFFGP